MGTPEHGTATIQSGENNVSVELEIVKRKQTDPDTLEPLDLTSSTVELLADDGSTFACSILDAINGLAVYVWTAGDLLPGAHDVQPRVTYPNGNIFKGPRFTLDIEPAVS